jgi:glucokinase
MSRPIGCCRTTACARSPPPSPTWTATNRATGDFAQLVAAARDQDPIAREAFALFSSWLGAVAGDLALVAGARSGVYIFSPMMLGWTDLFDRDLCRARFEAKGRMDVYMKDIPLYLVLEADCGLLGLSALYAERGSF